MTGEALPHPPTHPHPPASYAPDIVWYSLKFKCRLGIQESKNKVNFIQVGIFYIKNRVSYVNFSSYFTLCLSCPILFVSTTSIMLKNSVSYTFQVLLYSGEILTHDRILKNAIEWLILNFY